MVYQKVNDVKYSKQRKDADAEHVLNVLMWVIRHKDIDTQFHELKINIEFRKCKKWEKLKDHQRRRERYVVGSIRYTMKGQEYESSFDKRRGSFYSHISACTKAMYNRELWGGNFIEFSTPERKAAWQVAYAHIVEPYTVAIKPE